MVSIFHHLYFDVKLISWCVCAHHTGRSKDNFQESVLTSTTLIQVIRLRVLVAGAFTCWAISHGIFKSYSYQQCIRKGLATSYIHTCISDPDNPMSFWKKNCFVFLNTARISQEKLPYWCKFVCFPPKQEPLKTEMPALFFLFLLYSSEVHHSRQVASS